MLAASPESQAAALFLLYRPGAREVAMGESGVASAAGHAASWYNPSLVAWQTRHGSVGLTWIPANTELLDRTYRYLSTTARLDRQWSIALSIADEREVNVPGVCDYFRDARTTILVGSVAREFGERSSFGFSLKWIRERQQDGGFPGLGDVRKAGGWAVDLGVGSWVGRYIRLAAAIRNFGPNVRYTHESKSSPMPVNLSVGADAKVLRTKNHSLTLAGELYKPLVQDYRKAWYLAPIRAWYDQSFHEERRQIDLHLGAEYGWRDRLFVRGGCYRDWDGGRKWFTYGAGVRWPIWKMAVTADVSFIHATGGYDPEDGRRAFSLGVAL